MRKGLANPARFFVLTPRHRFDIVVPRGRLAELFAFAARLQRQSGLQLACFGHAGDGNIHTNIMVDFEKPGAQERSEAALDELFRWVLAHDGAITGEHGIGLAKKRWWPLAVSNEVREVHGELKRLLDPNAIRVFFGGFSDSAPMPD
jgi:glycolate oxidase